MLHAGLYILGFFEQRQRAEVVDVLRALLLFRAWILLNRGLQLGVCTSCLTSPLDQYQLLALEAGSYVDLPVGAM